MLDYSIITQTILNKAHEFGFLDANVAQIKISDEAKNNFLKFLAKKYHGNMKYLEQNTNLRFNPELLHNNTISIICVKLPYLTKPIKYHEERLKNHNIAYISNYALSRDYHKVSKQQLKKYASWINELIKEHNLNLDYRVFTDSAPILEVELAKNSGLGWRGKNTLLLNKNQGSTFFLGEIFTNLPLVSSNEVSNHCGSCTKCLSICPTNAFVAPYILDATKCISYLTIENKGSIPKEFRSAIGNRIYGCDDCQLVCPWNKFSQLTTLNDFNIRHNLDQLSLIDAFSLDENTWKSIMQGSPIYRIGYTSWLRNVAIALGNAKTTIEIINVLKSKLDYPSELVQEHIRWALDQHKIS